MKIRSVIPFILLLFVVSTSATAQDSTRQSSVMSDYLTEVDFIIDHIENEYISGRRGLSDEEWNRRVDMIYKKVKTCKDNYEYWSALRYIGLLIQDRHFQFPRSGVYNAAGFFQETDVILPLQIQSWRDGSVYNVIDYTSTIPQYAQIISVNGVSAQEAALLNRSLDYGEELSAMPIINSLLEKDPRYWCHFSNYFFFEQIKSPYEIEYIERGSSDLKRVTIEGRTRGYIVKERKKLKLIDYLGYKAVEYKKVEDSIGVLTINMFWGRNFFEMLVLNSDFRYPRQLRRAMRRVKRDDIKELIIDIRANAGGMGDNIAKTLSYFTDSTLHYTESARVTDSNRIFLQEHAYLSHRAKGKEEKERVYKAIGDIKDGAMFDVDSLLKIESVKIKKKHKNKYKGNVYLLTSNYTYSAAQIFAQKFQRLNIGLVAGQPCGGYSVITSGNAYTKRLPFTGWIPLNIPISTHNPGNIYEYETVDIPINQKFDDWLIGNDNTLNDFIKKIKSNQFRTD